MITILFFGNLGDIFPTMEISLPPSVITIEDLTLWLSENMFISEKTLLKKGK